MSDTKECGAYKDEKPVSEFHNCSAKPDGRQWGCKTLHGAAKACLHGRKRNACCTTAERVSKHARATTKDEEPREHGGSVRAVASVAATVENC
jgi:hypothetical protein